MKNFLTRVRVAIVSTVINIIYLIMHMKSIISAITKMKVFKSTLIKSLTEVELVQSKFEWVKDKPIDWRPWSIVMFMKDFKDDCDGAAVLGRWLLKQIGIKSSFYRLYSKDSAHLVTVSYGKRILISNSQVFELKKGDWENQVLDICSEQTGTDYIDIDIG